MKTLRCLLILCCVIALFHSPSVAQDRGFGAGIMIGEPTGFAVKNWLSRTTAFDAGIAWSFANDASLHLHADHLWHDFSAIETSERLPVYYGIGGRVKAGKDSRLGVRGVFGISYLLRNAPLDVFFEFAPIVDIVPETGFGLNAALGLRYYFK